ncbi:hypothetical protein [Bifidobacterium sp. ESL0764]|uniref:hypothetical protein n=1 Tax=Bifidobacterium sp. ESL0764 TaxID=2983228 RepID=UPI0023FA051E|nr:hypothetical protein [Bifidobacterium sp. ESL0764]WEV65652.1 hypothetical protein OZX71_07870 [Bifidobacterium sp. ESL0764]
MGFDLFMGGLAVVLAVLATWLILLFFRSPTSAPSPVEAALQGLRNLDVSDAGIDTSSDDNAAKGQSNETTAQISRISRLLILALVLTVIVFIPSLLSRFSDSLIPSWLINPWVQAILTTPAMFYCGSPIHREGWHALKRHMPDVNSLISLGATGAYIYSLAICVAGNQFPEGSRHAYFGSVNVIVALALSIELLELSILRDAERFQDSATSSTTSTSIPETPSDSIADRAFATLIAGVRKVARFSRVFTITVIIIAVWAFALLVAFGPQPRLVVALFGGVGVLVVAGFILAILAVILIISGRRKTRHSND